MKLIEGQAWYWAVIATTWARKPDYIKEFNTWVKTDKSP